jgi:hypothetical protein
MLSRWSPTLSRDTSVVEVVMIPGELQKRKLQKRNQKSPMIRLLCCSVYAAEEQSPKLHAGRCGGLSFPAPKCIRSCSMSCSMCVVGVMSEIAEYASVLAHDVFFLMQFYRLPMSVSLCPLCFLFILPSTGSNTELLPIGARKELLAYTCPLV